MFNGAPLAANLALFKKVPYDPIKDFTPVTTLWRGNFILMVNAGSPFRTVAELIEGLRTKGSKASYGYGSPPALSAAELLKHRKGLQAVGISYKTAAASLPEMYSGALDFQFIDGTFAMSQMRAGKLRGLATTGPERSPYIDLPTMREAAGIPDFEVSPWWGAFLPAGAKQPVVAKLEGWLNRIVAMEETRKFLAGNAADPFPGNAKSLAEHLPKEITRWAELARLAGIEPQ